MGKTYQEISAALGIAKSTLVSWRKNPEFLDQIALGRTPIQPVPPPNLTQPDPATDVNVEYTALVAWTMRAGTTAAKLLINLMEDTALSVGDRMDAAGKATVLVAAMVDRSRKADVAAASNQPEPPPQSIKDALKSIPRSILKEAIEDGNASN